MIIKYRIDTENTITNRLLTSQTHNDTNAQSLHSRGNLLLSLKQRTDNSGKAIALTILKFLYGDMMSRQWGGLYCLFCRKTL